MHSWKEKSHYVIELIKTYAMQLKHYLIISALVEDSNNNASFSKEVAHTSHASVDKDSLS